MQMAPRGGSRKLIGCAVNFAEVDENREGSRARPAERIAENFSSRIEETRIVPWKVEI